MKRDLWARPFLDSKTEPEKITKREQVFGYFLGPCLVYSVYNAVAGHYLTQFYTDVLGLAGGFLTMMPLLSKLLSGVVSLLIGRLIDRTRTRQGKARPWIFCSGALIALCGVLLYAVPRAGYPVQLAWVVVSYNLFFSLAFSTYSLSHSLMVPLSTRDTKQRDSLAMLTSTGTAMLPGMISTIVMPVLVRSIGVGPGAQGRWLTVMGMVSIVAIPAVLVEYFFTRERITVQSEAKGSEVAFGKQVTACFRDRYWVMVVAFTAILHLCNGLTTNSMLYYCNWVLGNSVDSGATKQILVNVIGQFPMGLGVAVLWPLVRRFGKRRVSIIGFSLASAGSLAVLLAGNRMPLVLAALFIKSVGSLPTYVMAALLAEALDHIEWKNGFRTDGFSASVSSITQTTVMGLSQTVLLAGITLFGYISPETTAQVVIQPAAMKGFFSVCFAGVPMAGYALCAVIMAFYDLERLSPKSTGTPRGER